jgi:hypothetical protein
MEDTMTAAEIKQMIMDNSQDSQENKQFDLVDVYSAASAAMRINSEYVKVHDTRDDKASNSRIMRHLLCHAPEMITEADCKEGAAMMEYIQGKLPELLSGQLETYWQQAVLMTEQKTIASDDYKKLAFIASLPSSYLNARQRENVFNLMILLAENSIHLGKIGEQVTLDVQILGAVYSKNYLKWYHTAITADGNLVRFPLGDKLERGVNAKIAGKIHRHADGNTTTLHYVRVKKILDNNQELANINV